jgi:protein CpxP
MTRSTFGIAGLAAAITLAAAGAGFAQSPPPPPGSPPHGGMRMMELKRPDPEARAQRLRDILQLTPAQEPALKAFVEAQKPPGPPASHGGRDKARTTPERLDQQRARMVERLAAFDRRAAATRTFYAQLTPSQKKAFDALPAEGGEHREIRIERRMMGPGPGGPPMDHARPE